MSGNNVDISVCIACKLIPSIAWLILFFFFSQKLSPQEQRIFKLYGKLPSRNELLTKKLKDRKFFDSGDYALSKAATKNESDPINGVGSKHPEPEDIPQLLHSQNSISSSSPPRSPNASKVSTVREHSSLHEEQQQPSQQ